ncbi:hypothetical protein [Flavobacterium sp. K5-23]|uniref:hypothetical protein n=1 Tax=Flavobacterium sp. K5-23 TaxID=2746225 RepID=UPI00200E352F|nr:hypothetical protein [Flavobacterium sp. K5-23]UQD57597.1 hypothetical protein FLAK523_14875 [Flavobacterium sp. K5-23]
MELDKIDIILEKYFQGETSISEENELKAYFSSSNIAPHLEEYKPMFSYFGAGKEQKFEKEIPLLANKRYVAWVSIAASIVVLFGIITFVFTEDKVMSKELGTYDDPEVALKETQKALAMLSGQVNVGIESVIYVKEYENAKNKIFVKH